MTFQAYLDNIKAKTGKTPEDFRAEARERGIVKYGDLMAWLKSVYGLGHGHANAIAQLIVHNTEDKLEKIKAGTGKTQADFEALAAEKGLNTYDELMVWLKAEHGLNPGQANTIAQLILYANTEATDKSANVAPHFAGKKAVWRATYDALLAETAKFGDDVGIAPTKSYISLTRGGKKFTVVAPTAERLDIGIKLKDVAPPPRFEAASNWNIMVTHRVRIHDPRQVDAEVLAWLKRAYDAA
jgi:hypothetical protein